MNQLEMMRAMAFGDGANPAYEVIMAILDNALSNEMAMVSSNTLNDVNGHLYRGRMGAIMDVQAEILALREEAKRFCGLNPPASTN